MWIFTVNGFFTVIQDRKDANFVWLRARLREDIERNFPGITAEEHPGADYLFRVKLPREVVAQRLFELTMENDVTSHFKDVMIRTASKPVHGSRSKMLYGVWHAGADMQPIPPYSKAPRPAPKPFVQTSTSPTWRPGDRTVGAGQRGLYSGNGAGFKGSEFDWDSQTWGGVSTPDPKLPSTPAPAVGNLTDEEFDDWWGSLTSAERDEYLDQAEADQRRHEAMDEDFGAAARFSDGPVITDVFPSPVNRPGNRRQRRKEKRRNRHNQQNVGTQADYEQKRAQRNREGLNGQEAQNRQAYLDKKGRN